MSFLDEQIRKKFNPQSVGVIEFAESKEFCGKEKLYPMQRIFLKLVFLEELENWEEDLLTKWVNGGRGAEVTISPNIRDRVTWCREHKYPHFNEVDIVAGRRASKGHVTAIAATKKLYDLAQLENPGRFFGIDPEKVIYFSCVAASLDQAKKNQFSDLYATIQGCAALKPRISKAQEESISIKTDSDEEIVAELRKAGQKIGRDFAKLRVEPQAANSDTLRGKASILTIFDEMAFMMPGESNQSAARVYAAAEPALAQFGPWSMIFCNSSPFTKIGQFYKQVSDALLPPENLDTWYPMRFALKCPSWAFFDYWWKDPERRFSRAIMVSPDWPDQLEPDEPLSVLDDESLAKREHEQLQEKSNPETYKVERRGDWAEVQDAYLDPQKVDEAFSGWLPNGLACNATQGGTYIYDYRGHCDPSSTTAGFGYAMAHVEEFDDINFPGGSARHVVFDKVKRWNPQDFPGGTINYLHVQAELAKELDLYRPSMLSFDQFNSRGLIDGLRHDMQRRNIFEVRIFEVTATAAVNWNRWEALKTALNLGLVHIPPDCIDIGTGFDYSEYASWELKFLQLLQTATTQRVEKQSEGAIRTKDIADCICEVSYKFIGQFLENWTKKNLGDMALEMGSERGYAIGGRSEHGPMAPSNRSDKFNTFYSGRDGVAGGNARARGFPDFNRPGRTRNH